MYYPVNKHEYSLNRLLLLNQKNMREKKAIIQLNDYSKKVTIYLKIRLINIILY